MMAHRYNFPPNRAARAATELTQAAKVREEACEVLEAVAREEGPLRVCEEAWDCVQACEGILRKHPWHAMVARARVAVKCHRRGDYD